MFGGGARGDEGRERREAKNEKGEPAIEPHHDAHGKDDINQGWKDTEQNLANGFDETMDAPVELGENGADAFLALPREREAVEAFDRRFKQLIVEAEAGVPRKAVGKEGGRFAEEAEHQQGGKTECNRARGISCEEMIEQMFEHKRLDGIDARENQGDRDDAENGAPIWEREA